MEDDMDLYENGQVSVTILCIIICEMHLKFQSEKWSENGFVLWFIEK